MLSQTALFRVAAIVILLMTGVELCACELFSPAACEISGAPADSDSTGPVGGDNCLCCCSHVLVRPSVNLTPAFDATPVLVLSQPVPPSADSPDIYHPPRA